VGKPQLSLAAHEAATATSPRSANRLKAQQSALGVVLASAATFWL
jgi:hypothetical protein